jgi:hypothetical protein
MFVVYVEVVRIARKIQQLKGYWPQKVNEINYQVKEDEIGMACAMKRQK